MKTALRHGSAMLVLVACTVACSKNIQKSNVQSSADIFSDRPITATPDLFVVTLSQPALLTTGHRGANGWEIPEAAKQAVLAEQAAFEKQLAQIAPDAKVVYKYRMVLNGVAVYSSVDVSADLKNMPSVRSVETVTKFARPQAAAVKPSALLRGEVNSVGFIGADKAHALGYTGKGMRIGVLDTGIDYTHKMLGGSGNAAEFKAIDPALPTNAFPNAKVVGGVDLVGSDFNAASVFAAAHLPKPDANPIDEAGHGSHVGGTIAGIGDGVNSYSGVAPDATLYAIKVFGKEGSTSDAVVIAGFEYSADPNGDLNPDDQLDVINLSLGGGFGQPHILYTEAVKNLSAAGTFVVASAGNSGATADYIVGAPSTADAALSVAASVDGSLHNWQFAAVRFATATEPALLAKAVEGPVSKPVAETSVEGELVDIGLADTDLSDEVKTQLQGKVAFIVRGKVPFADKLKRAAAAGAIGAVVYNNDSAQPIPMGGEGHVDMPAIMITQALGLKLKNEMSTAPVRVTFRTGEIISQPELIDTITDFSSKGPRSEDNLLKPEIAAPGARVISAAVGGGNATVEMDGTSMAGPHVAGAMALIKEAHRGLDSEALKAVAMDTSVPLGTEAAPILTSVQGAGRIQVDAAVQATVVAQPAALSLGRVQVGVSRQQTRTLKLRNLTSEAVDLAVSTTATPGLTLSAPAHVTLPANGEASLDVNVTIALDAQKFISELDGRVTFKSGDRVVAQIPAIAIRTQASEIKATGTPDQILLANTSPVEGLALAFNLIGTDAAKAEPKSAQSWRGRGCDLESAGYRVITKTTPQGSKEMAQFAFKLYDAVTTWHMCELSVLIDADGDGVADQELAGVVGTSVAGIQAPGFATMLLDAAKARAVRVAFETALANGVEAKPNYGAALLAGGGMAPFPQSTVAMLEIPLEKLAKGTDGNLHVKLATIGGGDVVEADDYLGDLNAWNTLSGTAEGQPWKGMSELTTVGAGGAPLKLERGTGAGALVLYYPVNTFDAGQAQIIGGDEMRPTMVSM